MSRFRSVVAALSLTSVFVVPLAAVAPGAGAAGQPVTTYTPGLPSLATITNGSTAAPWNEYQGDPAAGQDSVLPTYTPSAAAPTIDGYPNLSINPGASSGTDGASPYPSGTVGTPGPLDGYCGTGGNAAETTGTPARQPSGTTLPLAPAYFPHIVRNPDGSLTGYFDYRPKDADEALVAATSTDNGKDWIYDGEALEQNAGYCPNSDINDDGQGHANVIDVGGQSDLYTLERAAGDNAGVGLLVHTGFGPTETDPLGDLPATQSTGIDPDDFAAQTVSVGATPVTIALTQPVATSGPEQLVAGGFVDLTQTPVPTASSVITCTGVDAQDLSGCTSAGAPISVQPGDLIEQVIATISADLAASAPATACSAGSSTATATGTGSLPCSVPAGPNQTTGDGGLDGFSVNPTNPDNLTMAILNANAPNRLYIDGTAVYCNQANALPTNKIEDCTTGPNGSSLLVGSGDPLTADPIIPEGAQQTSGLVAPDGIVGVVPDDPYAPAGATTVMYTEKILNYFDVGYTGSKSTFSANMSIAYTDFPNTGSVSLGSGPTYTVYIGDATADTIVTETCTGLTITATGGTLTGCNGGTPKDTISKNSYIAGPGAAITAPATLAATTGSVSTNAQKLFKNNEDLTVLREAWTTDGVNFQTTGLPDGGIISGTGSQAAPGGSYSDINNPAAQASPANLNGYAQSGTADATEMRYVGSAGTVLVNPDGTYGLFLSGAWAADGDSDAFNQIFYSTSSDGVRWSEPVPVISTDYTFSASIQQDSSGGPLGISAYYEGRAYGPSVVENADGSLTMVFAGYRLPGSLDKAGTTLGTGSTQWTIGADDPALYRNILTVQLQSSSSPLAAAGVDVTASDGGSGSTYGDQVTYTATVAPATSGALAPTGTVSFTEDGSPIPGCSDLPLPVYSSPDAVSCPTDPPAGDITITATYSGDGNYAGSSGSVQDAVNPAPLTVTADAQSRLFGQSNPPLTATLSGFVLGQNLASSGVTGAPSCSSAPAYAAVGTYPIQCTQGSLASSNYYFATFVPGSLTVGASGPCLANTKLGALTVGAGQALCIASTGRLYGSITVKAGGALDLEGGEVVGAISATGASAVRMCGSTVIGPVALTRTSGLVLIGGDAATGACSGNSLTGPLGLIQNAGGVEFNSNSALIPPVITGTTGQLPSPDPGSVHEAGDRYLL